MRLEFGFFFLFGSVSSSLDDGDGSQLDRFLADAGRVTRVDNVRHVLVRLWRFFHDEFGRGDPNGNALLFEPIQHLGVVEVPSGFGPRQSPSL